MFAETDRRAVDIPMSARLPPEDDRWKFGCAGRCMVWLMEVDRICEAVYGTLRSSLLEEVRFTAEAG